MSAVPHRRQRWLVCLGLGLLGCASRPVPLPTPATPAESTPELPPEPRIRVCIAEAVTSVSFSYAGNVRLRPDAGEAQDLAGTGVLAAAVKDGAIQVRRNANALCKSAARLDLEPLDGATRWRVGDTQYRGGLQLVRTGDLLTLVNELPLEEYLRGVVPWEIGKQEPSAAAALEAQAVAARTYAYKRIGRYPEASFDVYDDVTDQVYQGCRREDSLANVAIRATSGLVLRDRDGPIEAYYSSTCGGHTARIEAVWNKPPEAALRGGRDAAADGGSYCAGSRHFRWSESWSGAGLERILQETLPREMGWPVGTPVGALVDLEIVARDESGRVQELRVQTSVATFRVLGDRSRWVLRPRDRAILRSTLFLLEVERQNGAIVRVIAYGGGNGHGVGMCQMGAIEMARRGIGSADILAHYYNGAALVRMY